MRNPFEEQREIIREMLEKGTVKKELLLFLRQILLGFLAAIIPFITAALIIKFEGFGVLLGILTHFLYGLVFYFSRIDVKNREIEKKDEEINHLNKRLELFKEAHEVLIDDENDTSIFVENTDRYNNNKGE